MGGSIQELEAELLRLFAEWLPWWGDGTSYDQNTPLIQTGGFDSMALLNLVLWIEEQVGKPMDVAALDVAALDVERDWNTVADIVQFVRRERLPGHA